MANGYSEEFFKANQTGVKAVLADLDLALTFMDLSDVSNDEQTVERNRQNARHAYESVLHFLEKLTPDGEEHRAVEARLALLRSRLAAVGYNL
jgi:hypothetical protein